jgi:hypothetical protein
MLKGFEGGFVVVVVGKVGKVGELSEESVVRF